MRSLRQVIVALLLCVCCGRTCLGQEVDFPGFNDYVQAAMAQWEVPGIAVAAVKEGEIVLQRGYGVRKAGDNAHVDQDTLFAIASNTKQMTAALMATFVDERRMTWDDAVKTHLPELELFDPVVSRELTLRDLLCHRNGLPDFGGDIVWWGSTYDRHEVLRRVRYVRPVSSFRSKWAYQNTMFIAAGEAIAKVSGQSWESTLQQRLLTPIGMTTTLTSARQLEGKSNVATPHFRSGDRVKTIAWRNLDNGGPAAGVISNARDMSLWLRWLLNGTVVDGRPIISPNSLRELWSPQTVMIVSQRDRELFGSQFRAYGLGWMIRDYHGMKVLMHGGWADGMYSFSAIVPERKAGVVVLSNLHNRDLALPLAYRLLDHCLNRTPKDWCGEEWKVTRETEIRHEREFERLLAERHLGTQPSLALDAFVGKFASELYGPIAVELRDNQLQLKLLASPTYIADLVHWHHDTFRAIWQDPVAETGFVTFTLGSNGRVADVRFRMAEFIDPSEYVYRRLEP